MLIVESPNEATAVVALNRPERRNALTIGLMQSLCHALESLAAEPGRRVVVLRGEGAAFCGGLDLYEAADLGVAETSAEWVARTFETIATSSLIVIAAAHGAAYAGGAGLLASCDLVVAADDLRIAFPEVRRGLVPALATAMTQSRLRAGDLRQLLLLGEPIDAQRAQSLGLVDRVVPADQLLPEARRIAAEVLKGAPEAVRQTKRLLRELSPADARQTLPRALAFHTQARRTAEATEGLAAFRERREPVWSLGTSDVERSNATGPGRRRNEHEGSGFRVQDSDASRDDVEE